MPFSALPVEILYTIISFLRPTSDDGFPPPIKHVTAYSLDNKALRAVALDADFGQEYVIRPEREEAEPVAPTRAGRDIVWAFQNKLG
jgi:hypothetical protein